MPPTYQSPMQRENEWRSDMQGLAQQPGILLDLGGGTPYQGYIRRGDVGSQTAYLCLDIRREAHPHVVADALSLPIADEAVNAIFCNAVLEHVSNPQQVINEMYRVLTGPGKIMTAVPFIYPYHDQVDYFRFTHTALQQMFHQFSRVQIVPVGDYFFVTLLFLTGFNFNIARRLDPLLTIVRFAFRVAIRLLGTSHFTRQHERSIHNSPVGWHIYATKA